MVKSDGMKKTAIESALDSLSRRALTTAELVLRLQKKGYSEQDIAGAVERLKQWGYLDDCAYALSFCQTHLNKNAQRVVYHKLLQKGLEPEVVHQAIAQVHSAERETELCLETARKYWAIERERWESKYRHQKQYQGYSAQTVIKEKVSSRLWRKGFSANIIRHCLEEMEKSGTD